MLGGDGKWCQLRVWGSGAIYFVWDPTGNRLIVPEVLRQESTITMDCSDFFHGTSYYDHRPVRCTPAPLPILSYGKLFPGPKS
jgi:hypothetical protein